MKRKQNKNGRRNAGKKRGAGGRADQEVGEGAREEIAEGTREMKTYRENSRESSRERKEN